MKIPLPPLMSDNTFNACLGAIAFFLAVVLIIDMVTL